MRYLMNGFVIARSVLMNQEGWTIIKDFRFFLNLRINKSNTEVGNGRLATPLFPKNYVIPVPFERHPPSPIPTLPRACIALPTGCASSCIPLLLFNLTSYQFGGNTS